MSQQSLLQSNNPVELYQQFMVPALFVPGSQVLFQYAQPKQGERVIDVACGTGVVARQVAELVGAQGMVKALDISTPMLTMARSLPAPEGAVIEWKEGNALSLPFADSTFDLALCQQGLQFFPDRITALEEMRRVLVPDGRVVVSVCQSFENNPIYKAFNNVIMQHLGIPALAAPFILGDADKLQGLLSQAGFQQVEVEPVAFPVSFPSMSAFIRATVIGSAAAITALQQLDAAQQNTLMEQVSEEMRDILVRQVESDGAVVFTLAINVGRGYK